MKCTTPHAWCNDSFRAYHFLCNSLAFCRSADRGKILFRRILLQCNKCFLTSELGTINPIKVTLKEEVSYNCNWCKHGKENLVKKKLGKLLSKNYLWNIILKYGENTSGPLLQLLTTTWFAFQWIIWYEEVNSQRKLDSFRDKRLTFHGKFIEWNLSNLRTVI